MGNMKVLRLKCIILAMMVMTLVFTACSKDTNQVDTPKPNESTEKTEASETTQTEEITYPLAEPGSAKLTFWTPMQPGVANFIQTFADTDIMKEIEKKTGVTIEFIHPAANQIQEQFNIMMVSGDLPDIISAGFNPFHYQGGSSKGVADGLFEDLTDLVPQYAPDYYKAIQQDDLLYKYTTDEDGKITAIYQIDPGQTPPPGQLLIRKDILEKTGLEIPYTLDEYEQLFDKIKEIGGIIPFQLNAPKQGIDIYILGVFDLQNGFMNKNGKVVYGPAQSEYKDYLELMSKWYAEGYLSNDFISLDNGKEFINGTIGAVGLMTGVHHNEGVKNGYEIVPLPHPRKTKDQQLHWESIWQNWFANSVTVISASSKNKELALKWLNYGFTEEGAMLYNWGIEGKSYTMVDGKPVYTDGMLKHPDYSTEQLSYLWKMRELPSLHETDVVCHANLLKDPGALQARLKWMDDPNVDSAFSLPNYPLKLEESSQTAQIMADVQTYKEEMTLKFIVGVEPISNFDKYIETLENFGIRKAEELHQQAYNRFMAR